MAPGGATPTGTVTFKDGSNVLANVPLVNGVAALTVSNLGQGTRAITAVYSGDALDQASVSTTLTQTVQSATTTTLSASRWTWKSARFGRTVTFTAAIRDVAPGTGTPAGVVTFYDGTTVLGTAMVNQRGMATFETSSLARGTHSIYAVYGGDATHQGSRSSAIVVTIS